ncbi:recombinase family protein [Sphingomonas olei]|uniref:Recombinase family protein n=1 Tax=Sphingomonas olei TaxID=1886787 RepID=A0ABY2QDE5_9SPHN|nr:recombinase family protein [Sphingomonas olei]THG36911.1 recombinase family protein [Sphingomonas olei]
MSERAIGYGRKSFDDPDQRTSSVDDQRMFAAAYAERHGFELVAFHGDNGITGATMERPGLQAMLQAVSRGEAKIVIIEDVDRLGRDQEHLQHMIKLFRVYDVVIHTVAAGRIDDLVFAFKGIIGEQQRMRIAYTTRRGLKGKASRGGATGGRVLGYERVVTGQDVQGRDIDCLAVEEEQAALVRRIFQLYADGHSLKQICNTLNAEGVPSPRARERGRYNAGIWNPSTLSGDVTLGEGILNNEIYVGRRIFNRRRWVEVPNERRGFSRKPRLNPEAEWVVRDEPTLRIIDQPLWDAVKIRQAQARLARDEKFGLTANPLSGAKRPAHLLSGLVECGACGSPVLATGAGRWRCKGHRTGMCTNGSVTTRELENRAFAGIRDKLLTPEVVSQFAAALQREIEEAHRTDNAERARQEMELSETRARIAKLVTRIEEDDDAPRSLSVRLKELETTEQALEATLAILPERQIVQLPANYEALYLRAVTNLDQHLASGDGATARQVIRPLIEKIVVQPGDARGGKRRPMQLHGDLFRMLELTTVESPDATKPRPAKDGAVVTPLVAGTGFEPVTFRL